MPHGPITALLDRFDRLDLYAMRLPGRLHVVLIGWVGARHTIASGAATEEYMAHLDQATEDGRGDGRIVRELADALEHATRIEHAFVAITTDPATWEGGPGSKPDECEAVAFARVADSPDPHTNS